MLHKIIVCCLVVVALAFPARASSLWHPEPGFLPEDARHAVPNNPAPPERTVPEQVLPPLPVQDEGTIRRVATKEKVAALTFDLCELSTMTTGYDAEIIDFLREKRIPATLFMGGKWMRSHSERAMQLMADPLFEIGNHGWSHGNFGIMSEKAMLEQIRWTQAEYELLREEILKRARAEGRSVELPEAVTLFRLPYGRCTDKALALLAREGLQVIQWSVVAETPQDNAVHGMGARVAGQVRPGAIILFHANLVPKGSAFMLKETVGELQRKGYRFVTVGELLKLGEPQRTRDGYFKKITPQSLRMSGEQKLKDGDEVLFTCESTNSVELLFFTNHRQVYKSHAYDFNDSKASVLGDYVASALGMEEGEVPLYMVVTPDYKGWMLFFYDNGKCAKVPLSSYETKQNRRKLLKAYSDKAELAFMRHLPEETELAIFTTNNRLLLVGSALIPEKTTRDTAGVSVVALKKNAKIARVTLAEGLELNDAPRYRVRTLPAAGAILKDDDRAEQLTL